MTNQTNACDSAPETSDQSDFVADLLRGHREGAIEQIDRLQTNLTFHLDHASKFQAMVLVQQEKLKALDAAWDLLFS